MKNVHYTQTYDSPIGKILLASDDIGLIGSWFYNQKYFAKGLNANSKEFETEVLKEAKSWLDEYFSGKIPNYLPKIHLTGTAFQVCVWNILKEIPYAKTVTYGEIAAKIAKINGIKKMSARAVGCAVGQNKISIIVPCHRVLGSKNRLTGYAGGIDKKIELLKLEGAKFLL